MNSKNTFYLIVLTLGVFAYILIFERHTLDTADCFDTRRNEPGDRAPCGSNRLSIGPIRQP